MNSTGDGKAEMTPLSKSKASEIAFIATTIWEPGQVSQKSGACVRTDSEQYKAVSKFS